MPAQLKRSPASDRRGYVMLVALIIMALIAVIAATSLEVAGVDQRIAIHNQRHMMMFNTSTAGVEHARAIIDEEAPVSENLDSAGDSYAAYVTASEAESMFGGTSYGSNGLGQNLGVYYVEAVYERCANPPPGYSTEAGRNGFRSDFWSMESTSMMTDNTSTWAPMNDLEAQTVATVRNVVFGNCKVR